MIPLPYTLHILAHAERDLKSITKSAPSSGVVIAAEIRKLPASPRPSGYSPVIGQKGLFRVHAAKKYRVIYSILDELRVVMIVADYPDDQPFSSCLMLGFVDERPIHVVVAVESETKTSYIVTAYDPDPDLWEPDFRNRRSQ